MSYHPPYLHGVYPRVSTEKQSQAMAVVDASYKSLREGLLTITDPVQRKPVQDQLDRAEKEMALYRAMLQNPTNLLSSPFIQVLQYTKPSNPSEEWRRDELVCEIYVVAQGLALAVLSYLELKYPGISAYFLMVLHATPPLFTDVYLHYENPSRVIQFHLCPVDDVQYPVERGHHAAVWNLAQAYRGMCRQMIDVTAMEFYSRNDLAGKVTYSIQTKEVICKIPGMIEATL